MKQTIDMNSYNYEEILNKIIEATNSLEYLLDVYENIKSSTMKKLLGENIQLISKIEELSIIIYKHLNANVPSCEKISQDIINELYTTLIEKYKVGRLEAIKALNERNCRSQMIITAKSKMLIQNEIVNLDWMLLDLIGDMLQFDYRNVGRIVKALADIIGDNLPGISNVKNAIETIKNLASITNELDVEGSEADFTHRMKDADGLILEFEMRNNALLATYNFLCSIKFIQEELSKTKPL